jgi:adenosylcobinamide-GDP ribazoletransferase
VNSIIGGLRLAISLLTVVPSRPGGLGGARWAMAFAPAAGLVVGVPAGAVIAGSGLLGAGPALGAALAVAMTALLTRGLHLDGLADLADGLGSGRPAAEALTIMRRSDVGPFGVVTLVLMLLVQVTALAQAPHQAYAVTVAAVTGRLALPWACRRGVPAARPEGLGALVAGTVRLRDASVASLAVAGAAALAGLAVGGVGTAVSGAVAVLAGPAVSWPLLRHAVRRLGGVTGDVLGALVETSATAALLTLCLRP